MNKKFKKLSSAVLVGAVMSGVAITPQMAMAQEAERNNQNLADRKVASIETGGLTKEEAHAPTYLSTQDDRVQFKPFVDHDGTNAQSIVRTGDDLNSRIDPLENDDLIGGEKSDGKDVGTILNSGPVAEIYEWSITLGEDDLDFRVNVLDNDKVDDLDKIELIDFETKEVIDKFEMRDAAGNMVGTATVDPETNEIVYSITGDSTGWMDVVYRVTYKNGSSYNSYVVGTIIVKANSDSFNVDLGEDEHSFEMDILANDNIVNNPFDVTLVNSTGEYVDSLPLMNDKGVEVGIIRIDPETNKAVVDLNGEEIGKVMPVEYGVATSMCEEPTWSPMSVPTNVTANQVDDKVEPCNYVFSTIDGTIIESSPWIPITPMPEATPDHFSVDLSKDDTTVEIDVLENDDVTNPQKVELVDGNGNVVESIEVTNTNGDVVGTATVDPETNKVIVEFNGENVGTIIPINYKVTDENGASVIAIINGEITMSQKPIIIPPKLVEDEFSKNIAVDDLDFSMDILANDGLNPDEIDKVELVDADGNAVDRIELTNTNGDAVGTITIDPTTNHANVSLNGEEVGTINSVRYKVTLTNGISVSTTIKGNIVNVTDIVPITPAPKAEEDSFYVNLYEDEHTFEMDILENDTVENGVNKVELVDANGNVVEVVELKNNDDKVVGTVKIDPETNKAIVELNGEEIGTIVPVRYKVTDNEGGMSYSTISGEIVNITDIIPISPVPNEADDHFDHDYKDGGKTVVDITENDPTKGKVELVNENGNVVEKITVTIDGKEAGTGTIDENGNLVIEWNEDKPVGKIDPISYKITDENGTSTVVVVTGTVKDTIDPTPINPAPKAEDDHFEHDYSDGGKTVIDITDNDPSSGKIELIDENGNVVEKITVTIDGKEAGTGTIDENGNLVIEWNEDKPVGKIDPISYKITDENGTSTVVVVTGKVTDVVPAIPITPDPSPEQPDPVDPAPEKPADPKPVKPAPVDDGKVVPVEDEGKSIIVKTGEAEKDNVSVLAAGLGALLALGGALVAPIRRRKNKSEK